MRPSILAIGLAALTAFSLIRVEAVAAPNWGVDLTSASLSIDADAYADNGVNGFRPIPGAIWFEDAASDDISDVQTDLFASFFGQPAETYDLGSEVSLFGEDEDFNPFFRTSASSVGVIAIDGVGTRTLNIYWRVNTANNQSGIGGEGFLSDSMADLTAQIVATIDGVAPGTALTIDYEWEYLGIAVIDHEALIEDPTVASGSLTFVDEQGNGPGNLFSELFAEPGPLSGSDEDNGSYDIITSNTADPSFLTIDIDSLSSTIMDAPGDPPLMAVQLDTASSVFNGRLTLTLPVPEPTGLAFFLLGSFAALLRRRRQS